MARGQTAPRVGFSREVESCRQPRDDELSVMTHFARHAGRCDVCVDPYAAYRRDLPLCDKGHALAMDVANYIYGKGGKPFSVIDKKQEGESVRLEVPAGCEVINDLCKAFCKGMTLKKREKRPKPIIVVPKHETVEAEKVERSPRFVYYPSQRDPEKPSRKKEYVVDDRPRETRYNDVNVVEITPGSSRKDRKEKVYYNDKSERRERPKSVVYPDRKGSLYERDEEEKRRRKVYEDQPIVIVAEPSRRYVRR